MADNDSLEPLSSIAVSATDLPAALRDFVAQATTLDVTVYDSGTAVVTLNRPDVLNAFNRAMVFELRDLWRVLRDTDEVRCIVLTGAGDRAFCTGIDRSEQIDDGEGGARAANDASEERFAGFGSTPFHFDDPGDFLGPKTNDLWKPVIGAVNGMACGGAFYLLGECDVLIAAEHATFFDPHVTYGMTATFEPLLMMHKMPFGELARMSLVGNHERISAERAYAIGLVSEVCASNELETAARRLGDVIASAPPLAVQGTLRSLWAGLELSRSQALQQGWAFVGLGTNEDSLAEGQAAFASGKRIKPRLR